MRQRWQGDGAAGEVHLSWKAQFLVFEPQHDGCADVVESAEAEQEHGNEGEHNGEEHRNLRPLHNRNVEGGLQNFVCGRRW